MTSDRLVRLKEMVVRASELPEEDRRPFLQSRCGGDLGLLREAESLLAQQGETSGVMQTGALDQEIAALVADGARSRAPVPQAIGPFRILDRLGEGGMGSVYRAEQTEPIRREVALKVIRTGMDSAGILARFESERQTLARMDHPNIAKVLDAGSDDQGRPWFAMELVRGESITAYCRSRALDLNGRVRLFLEVCRAVRHAHRRGIIHRDLKPSNILVAEAGGRPLPKVIDFSIAKALDDPALGTEHRTRTGQVIGTLEYMSPEQARGEIGAIDTRSDVYALGVVLHEILMERLPIEVGSLPLHEAVRRIVEDPPTSLGRTLPGTTTGSRSIDADVATIVGKCLEKESDRRYESAAELVEDLERYLDSRPILARPPTAAYQLRKLVGRHRVAAGVAALVFVFLIVFGATVSVQLGIQSRERQRAEAEARKAERTVTFLREMLAAASPEELGRDATVREVLDRAAETIDAELSSEPEVLVDLHATLADTYEALGELDAGLEQADRAVAVASTTGGIPVASRAMLLADRAGLRSQLGRHDEALAGLGEAKALLQEAGEAKPPDRARMALIETVITDRAGDLPRAEELAREAIRLAEQAHGEESREYVTALMALGSVLRQGGIDSLDEAEGILNQVVDLTRERYGEEHPRTQDARLELAAFLGGGRQRYHEAVALQARVLEARRKLYGSENTKVAEITNNLAVNLMQAGRLAEAAPHAEEAARIWKAVLGKHLHVAAAFNNLGYLRMALGEPDAAVAAFRECLSTADGLPGWKNAQVWYSNLGYALDEAGRTEEALEYMDKAEVWLRDNTEAEYPNFYLGFLKGSVLASAGRCRDAEPFLRLWIDKFPEFDFEKAPETNMGTRGPANVLGRCRAREGRREEAEELLAKARPWLLSGTSWPHVRRHELERTAVVYESWGEAEMAARYREALEAFERRIREGPEADADEVQAASR